MIIIALLVLCLDIISKVIVINYLSLEKSLTIINNFLYLTYVRNTGVAWSILENNAFAALIISLVIIIGIINYVYKNKINNKLEKIAYALVLGGAVGNLIDRIIYGYVIDFIDVRLFNYNYPIFNLADIFIVVGVILLVIHNWRNNDGNKRK